MDDLISRQAAIDEAKEWIDAVYFEEDDKRERKAIECFIGSLKNMPSAQQWIPCSERLPEVSYDYLGNWSSPEVILLMNDEEYIRVCNGHFNPIGAFEVFEYDGLAFVGRPVEDVFAWMPLPEPYKGEES